MHKIEKLNEKVMLELHSLATINEMAKIEKEIELRNEDDGDVVKFAHFHFRGVHFKFMRECPQTKEDIIKMVAFPKKELQTLSAKDIRDLLRLLNSKYSKDNRLTVYDACKIVWDSLHDREIDYI